ncbi:copper resistance system multicopper oxidase [Psychrobacter sanguinis]|uniref:copper resistance system multicopper oxidase n=1 Tax=Psychrobacter sanguinis TaxID=861445 RepID=UPI00020C9B77|nr:copper resistance system multicopper oxidase [Psychrobacter sanguinis]EGK11856.1 P-ATPase superfamily P-type ATPase copper transporter [Psychrobacter sp. 1501(2011)]MCC3307582.1 copper resistance system multicopper oxidase [Psychrobacter sanguinis]MCD9151686.1 copper resistance system multicopper oxidase [Psychrobacter sanguinis]UEC24913.1 copper resistance system multicopper oxidase [Psychrobacter sanguinis]
MNNINNLNRRKFLSGAGIVAGSAMIAPAWAGAEFKSDYNPAAKETQILTGNEFDLYVRKMPVVINGRNTTATLINDSLPAPTLKMKEGETVTIRVHNEMEETTSIHWHGLIVPYEMDGVPGISFDGIPPKSTFTYTFKLQQSGTYWYHSHSGFQEQTGMFGAIVIEPKGRERHPVAEDHVVVLSDWTYKNPHTLLKLLKQRADFDNYHLPDFKKLLADIAQTDLKTAMDKRKMWNQMRMMPTDFSDLTGENTFTYLINGRASDDAWYKKIKAGQAIKLRFINASAQTIFDVRIPGLKMTVVATDGIDVDPVSIDDFRIGVAETFDLIVTPTQEAHTIFAQNVDRTGYVTATLATKDNVRAAVPAMDGVEWLTMADMMGDMENGFHAKHARTEYDFKTDMRVDMPRANLDDPGINLRNIKRDVLTYDRLSSVDEHIFAEQRAPTREIELHLTGNMERYIWAFDGVKFADAKPVNIKPGERVRITLVNDTMMMHPMHLHGMWSDMRTATGEFQVRKHTMLVHPAQKISFDVTGEAGRWAWHCHLLYHMEAGMFREVAVI